MLPYKYAYLVGAVFFLIPWIVIFVTRKDLRKAVLLMSLIGAVVATISNYLWWTHDWWHPLTITNTRVGLEDIIAGWANGGVVASIYEFVLKKKIIKSLGYDPRVLIYGLVVCAVSLSLSGIVFWLFHLSSFIACVASYCLGTVLILLVRKDLLKNSLMSGILMVVTTAPVFLISEILFPGVVNQTWDSTRLSNIRLFLVIPIEDVVFYFLLGTWIGPLYKMLLGLKNANLSD